MLISNKNQQSAEDKMSRLPITLDYEKYFFIIYLYS